MSNVEALSANASKGTGVPTAPIINLDTPGSGRSASPNLSNLSHLSQPVKKESNIRSWFHLPNVLNAGSLTGRSTPAPVEAKGGTSIYSTEIPTNSTNDDTNDDTNSPPQSTKTSSKTNFGDSFYNKQNKLKEQTKITSPGSPAPSTSSTPSSNVVVVAAATTTNSANSHVNVNRTEQQQQTKSSRRTTSLLNLFMSNSQGNRSPLTFYIKYLFSFFYLYISSF